MEKVRWWHIKDKVDNLERKETWELEEKNISRHPDQSLKQGRKCVTYMYENRPNIWLQIQRDFNMIRAQTPAKVEMDPEEI